MKIAVISDIHANEEALAASLYDMSAVGIDKVVVLGDIVGYGADPESCTAAVMVMAGDSGPLEGHGELADAVKPFEDRLICAVMGNHDLGAVNDEILMWMRDEAVAAVLWQRKQVSDETLSFIGARPMTVSFGDALFTHSTPYRPETFDYVMHRREAAAIFTRTEGRLFFIGHTHIPVIFGTDGFFDPREAREFTFDPDGRYIVNVGSIGQPRDGDHKASYVVWYADENRVEFRRVEYDVGTAARKIYDARLPRMLGDRLFVGF